jgi:hypothetical protein
VYSTNLALHRLLKPLLDEAGLTYPQFLVLIDIRQPVDDCLHIFVSRATREAAYFSQSASPALVGRGTKYQ